MPGPPSNTMDAVVEASIDEGCWLELEFCGASDTCFRSLIARLRDVCERLEFADPTWEDEAVFLDVGGIVLDLTIRGYAFQFHLFLLEKPEIRMVWWIDGKKLVADGSDGILGAAYRVAEGLFQSVVMCTEDSRRGDPMQWEAGALIWSAKPGSSSYA